MIFKPKNKRLFNFSMFFLRKEQYNFLNISKKTPKLDVFSDKLYQVRIKKALVGLFVRQK